MSKEEHHKALCFCTENTGVWGHNKSTDCRPYTVYEIIASLEGRVTFMFGFDRDNLADIHSTVGQLEWPPDWWDIYFNFKTLCLTDTVGKSECWRL